MAGIPPPPACSLLYNDIPISACLCFKLVHPTSALNAVLLGIFEYSNIFFDAMIGIPTITKVL